MAPFSKERTILKWEKPIVWFQKFPNLICLSDNIKVSVTYPPCGWCHSLKLREKQGVGWASVVRCDRKLHLSFRTTTIIAVMLVQGARPGLTLTLTLTLNQVFRRELCRTPGWATWASWHRRSWRKRWGRGERSLSVQERRGLNGATQKAWGWRAYGIMGRKGMPRGCEVINMRWGRGTQTLEGGDW